jgi:hypothetical protein
MCIDLQYILLERYAVYLSISASQVIGCRLCFLCVEMHECQALFLIVVASSFIVCMDVINC